MERTMSDEAPMARVVERDGQLVLEDPVGYAVATAVERVNLYRADSEAVRRLERRAEKKGAEVGSPFAVVVIDVDCPTWSDLVAMLMPGHDWNQFRARGEQPVARGVVPRDFLCQLLDDVRKQSGELVTGATPPGLFTAVFGRGGVTLFEVT
jgi:hypothetical protein